MPQVGMVLILRDWDGSSGLISSPNHASTFCNPSPLALVFLQTESDHGSLVVKVMESWLVCHGTATAGSDVVQSGRPIFDDFFQHLWPYIGNNTANAVFQMVKRLWLIRIDQ
ncbi:hypothetical protein TNCV_4246341 [Trichonephila clavipes]|nr:hypothetical protein TNCV_4246341 [Trichonephila clavipes]